MLSKIYLETTNVCNLSCSFCHGTCRTPKYMTIQEFDTVISAIKGKAKYLYLHLMGEPLLQPHLAQMAHKAHNAGFEVMLTTNGTLLSQCGEFIYKSGDVKKVSISLQSVDIENNRNTSQAHGSLDEYLKGCADFAAKCAQNGVICVLRLWNLDGNIHKNDEILQRLHTLFPEKWIKNRSGYKLFDAPKGQNEVYLEFGEQFTWPDKNGNAHNVHFCHALRDQIGILCDGTVVPCCLDADGEISLGNIFESDLDSILSSPRAVALADSFEKRTPCEALCKTCGYAQQFG